MAGRRFFSLFMFRWSDRLHGMALDKPAARHDLERVLAAVSDEAQQALDSGAAHALLLEVDGCELGACHGADGQVIDTDDRDVFRHALTKFLERPQQVDGQDIVVSENGRRQMLWINLPDECMRIGTDIVGHTVRKGCLIRQTKLQERLTECAAPRPKIRHGVCRRQMANLSVPSVVEVLYCAVDGLLIVHDDGILIEMAHLIVEHDERRSKILQQWCHFRLQFCPEEDDAVIMSFIDDRNHRLQILFPHIHHGQRIAVLSCRALDAVDDARDEVTVLADHVPFCLVLEKADSTLLVRDAMWQMIAADLRNAPYLLALLLTDTGLVVEHERDRRLRDARPLSNVLQRDHAAIPFLFSISSL